MKVIKQGSFYALLIGLLVATGLGVSAAVEHHVSMPS